MTAIYLKILSILYFIWGILSFHDLLILPSSQRDYGFKYTRRQIRFLIWGIFILVLDLGVVIGLWNAEIWGILLFLLFITINVIDSIVHGYFGESFSIIFYIVPVSLLVILWLIEAISS